MLVSYTENGAERANLLTFLIPSLRFHVKVPYHDHSSIARAEKGKGAYPQSGDPLGLFVLYSTLK